MAGVRGVTRMRLTALLTASLVAVALAVPASAALASGGGGQTAAAPTVAKPVQPRFRAAYKHWRGRLKQHGLFVGRDLLADGAATAAEDGSGAAAKRDLRHSIHRMQRRWGRWLRHDPQGRAVAFKIKVRRQVPGWGKAHLRSIAWCESKNDPHAVGGGGAYRGMYQFSVGTWQSVGGSGDPAAASEGEQDRRAAALLARDGAGQWPVCGA